MAKRVLAAFMATSDHIPGRQHQLSEDDIRALAEMVTPEDQLHLGHDERVVVPGRLIKAELRRTDSGSLGLWVEHEIDEEDAALLPESFGYSVAFAKEAEPSDPDSTLPPMQVVIDSANFSDVDFRGAVDRLRHHFNVSAGWMQQYSELPPPNVIIALGLQWVASIPPELLKSLILDSIKDWLFRPARGGPTSFTLTLRSSDREIKARIDTADPEMFGDAIELLRETIKSDAALSEFDHGSKTWKKVR